MLVEYLSEIGHTVFWFIIILSIIVFIHEFGHYLMARLCGVRIEVFSIGFGKEIFGLTDRTGTRWKFSLLPFGGYVKMFGDTGAASTPDGDRLQQMSAQEKQVSFHYKPLWQKAIIVAGGPVFNFLTTIAVFTWFAFSNGIVSTEPVIGEVIADSAAQEAGLLAGDRFLSINGREIEIFNDIPVLIVTNLGTEITAKIEREGQILTKTITPKIIEVQDDFGNTVEKPLIGIRSQKMSLQEVGLGDALRHAGKRTWEITVATIEVIGQLVTGKRDTDQLKGPIGIAQMSGQAADAGTNSVLWFIALLSANLGLINLLPIPMLDGGHLLYYAIEAGRGGKPMAEKFQQFGYKLGGILLLALMGFTIINDIIHL